MQTLTDTQLLERAREGDEAALTELYQRHRNFVFNLARRSTGCDADAADVLQEVFFHFFDKLANLHLNCELRTWLFSVTRNRSISLLRKKWKRTHEQFDEGHAPAHEDEQLDSQRELIEHMTENLSEVLREVVLLRFCEELSLEQIAERLELPLGTVKSRLHNALKLLRRQAPQLMVLLTAFGKF